MKPVYSEYWRKNRSRTEAHELALALRALRKVAGHLGRNVKPVYWKGMVEDDNRAILVDTAKITGKYPISHKRFDPLVGQVALEGLLSMEWTEWVKNQMLALGKDIPHYHRVFLNEMVQAGEDIYIFEMAGGKVWHLYMEAYWNERLARMNRDPVLPPSAESLADMWRRKMITKNLPSHMHFYYDDCMEALSRYTPFIRGSANLPSLSERRQMRLDLFAKLWKELYPLILEWEKFHFDPDSVSFFQDDAAMQEEARKEPLEPAEEEDEQLPEIPEEDFGLDQELAEEVNALMDEDEADLTKIVAVAVQDPEAGEMGTHYQRSMAPLDLTPDEAVVKRLRRIFREQEARIRKSRKRRTRRGLAEGKIDAGRLYRVATDGRVFKDRERPKEDLYWQIAIVADASASMSGRSAKEKNWVTAERTFASLAEAAKGYRNLLDIYAYNEDKNTCHLTDLYHGGALYSVSPRGRTPSGQAILALAASMKRQYKKCMIIHITDGAANCGVRLKDAVDYCRKNDVEVYTIGCGCNQQTRDFLQACFPANALFFMQSIHHLHLGLERLFNKRILQVIK